MTLWLQVKKNNLANLNREGRVDYENTRCFVVPVFIIYSHSDATRKASKTTWFMTASKHFLLTCV